MAIALRSVRSAYRTSALVDWLTLEIETARPTQFQWLQRTLTDHFGDDMRPYIDAVNPSAGNTASKFLIRFNDTHCWDTDTIRAALAALDQRYLLVGPAIIKALEVSLDFYPNDDQAHADLLQLVRRLQISLEAAGGASHRQVGPSKRVDFLDSTSTPDPQQTLYINNRVDPVSWRVYHKVTDRDQPLRRDEHRARVEFTLQGTGLKEHGIYSLDDLAERGFIDFGRLLHFRQFRPMSELIVGKNPTVVYALLHGTKHDRNMMALYPFGRQAYRRDSRTGKPRNGGRPELRNHSTHTVADDELNHIVRDRLRDLTRRFRKKLEAKN